MRGRLPTSRLSSGIYSSPQFSTAVLETFWRRVVSDKVEAQSELIDVPCLAYNARVVCLGLPPVIFSPLSLDFQPSVFEMSISHD